MPRACVSLLALAAVLPGAGCSLTAKKVPTPAAELRSEDLARIPKDPSVRYYLILFGSQDLLRRPAYTHTWATLVKATDRPGRCPALEVHTISWLPTKIEINALSRHVEPGANLGLEDTIKNALDTRQRIAMWGPYEVWRGFAYRFLTQKAFLDSGAVGYQCIDSVGEAGRNGNGCDCIHAITDMDPAYPRYRYPLALYGHAATANLVRRLMHSPIFIDPPTTHNWLIPELGLHQYPIEWRQYHGNAVPHTPGSGDLDVAPARPGPAAPVVPKTDGVPGKGPATPPGMPPATLPDFSR